MAKERKKRGRPAGPKTVRFHVLLFPGQLETLTILSQELEGTPPVTGLIRVAVDAYIEAKLRDKELRERVQSRQKTSGRSAKIALVP